jgi:tRNA threonylcarbamoyladenosine biosynthesis protein TsaE
MMRVTARDAAETQTLGARLAPALVTHAAAGPVVVTLAGDLGAGKTTLVGGLLAALGHMGPVRSPTYTLIEPYRLQGLDIQHCDLYRLRHAGELDDLGWRDLLVPGAIVLVEWPEKAGDRLGPVDIAITIAYDDTDSRQVTVESRSSTGDSVLDEFRRQ